MIFFEKSLKILTKKLSLKTEVFILLLGENAVAITIKRQGSPVWEC